MKNLKKFKNISNKHKLAATFFSLALVTSMTTGCVQSKAETGYYIVYNDQGIEVVLTAKQYNELIENTDDSVIIRSYGGTITITKENLLEGSYQKDVPNSLQK